MRLRARPFLSAIGILVVILSVACLGWVVVNCRDAAVADLSDLIPSTVAVPDEDNAYLLLDQAAVSLHWPKREFNIEFALEEWDDASAVEAILSNHGPLALLEQGLACPPLQSRGASSSQSHDPRQWDRLLVLLAQKAAYERRTAEAATACESSCNLLRLGCLISSHPQSPTEWLSGLLAIELGLEGIERLLCDAQWEEVELVRLLERLNGVGVPAKGLAEAFREAFQMESRRIDERIGHRSSRKSRRSLLARYSFQPNRTRAEAARFYRRLIESISRPYAEVRMPQVQPSRIHGIHRYMLSFGPNQQGRVLREMFLSERNLTGHCLAKKYEVQSHLDGLRLIVACRIYESRHGRLPEALDMLTPELLGAVPHDPFDGASFRYVRAAAVVYSVGADLKDSWASNVRPSAARPVDHGEPAEASDWPEYRPAGRLLGLRDESGDLVYYIHSPPQ